ncbi:cytochrome P450 [Xylariomycetidae sp. FL2044]|nr:cytochrome P450 [Xylariomycetidae sp. FL2044]
MAFFFTDNSYYALALIAILGVYVGRWIVQYIQTIRSVRGLAQIHTVFGLFETPLRALGIPHVPFIWPVKQYTIDDHWKKYATARCDLLALTQLRTPDHALYITSSPEAMQFVFSNTDVFLKPVDYFLYSLLNLFGKHIISAQNGSQHKRHKAVVRGFFGESTMELGWEMAAASFKTMLREEKLAGGGKLSDVKEVMAKVTLHVISKAWFGIDTPWQIPKTNNAMMPFYEALHEVEESIFLQLLLPLWFMEYSPLPSLRRLGKAQRSMLYHLKKMIAARRSQFSLANGGKTQGASDLIGALVASQMQEEMNISSSNDKTSSSGLTEQEVIGNIWVFVMAGHETSAHTLAYALALLAIHPEWQEKLHKEITDAVGDDSVPTYKDINSLPLVLATAYEALRLRDLAMTLTKLVSRDTYIPYSTWDEAGEVSRSRRFIPKGSEVILDTTGCQLNPLYWDEPSEFRPSRFLGEEGNRARAGFLGFAKGERQCIGKRFAEVEMVCFLSHMVKTFRWSVVARKGETREQMCRRVLSGKELITLTPGFFELDLKRRS